MAEAVPSKGGQEGFEGIAGVATLRMLKGATDSYYPHSHGVPSTFLSRARVQLKPLLAIFSLVGSIFWCNCYVVQMVLLMS